MRIFKCIWIVTVGLILSGFSPMIMQSATEKDDANAKLFAPEPDRALVYVFRDKSFLGKDLTSELVINKVTVTKNKPGQFSVVSLAPGPYDFFSYSSHEGNMATAFIHNKNKPPIQLTAEPGKLYYFQEVFKSMGGFFLKVVPEEEAKPKIKKCKMAALHRL